MLTGCLLLKDVVFPNDKCHYCFTVRPNLSINRKRVLQDKSLCPAGSEKIYKQFSFAADDGDSSHQLCQKMATLNSAVVQRTLD